MRRIFHSLVLAAAACPALLIISAPPAGAIPVFARKYGFNCTMCHSNFPRLNDFGARYRKNGYRLPGRENEEKTVLESPTPLALRTSAGYNYDKFHNSADPAVRQFQLNGLDLVSGGLVNSDAGYIFVYTPMITGSRGVAAQDGVLEMANIVFSGLGSTWLNVRAGRFEPAYAAPSVKRQLMVSPFEIYDFTFAGGAPFSETREGVELSGYGRSGMSYAAGWLNSAGPAGATQTSSDFYARVEKVFGEGEGQTAGQRIGLTGYSGRARPDITLPPSGRRDFRRAGVDASLNYRSFNLSLQYMNGKDDKVLWGRTADLNFTGGFAELNWLPSTSLVYFARFDTVNAARSVSGDISRLTLGGRYYPADNMALHPEYSARKQKGPAGEVTENFFTVRMDYAF
ncbi:MAG: hypothetical protein PHV36_03085 [Elusimicrobiales bacterium]|nr:hypothetical protein [Elusimicrobiales bacterium]